MRLTVEMQDFIPAHSKEAIMAEFGLQEGGRVQQAIDEAVIDYCLPYCPMETGTLAKSAYAATRVGSGVVEYAGPYAHYMYYGNVYGPNIPIKDEEGNVEGFFSKKDVTKQPTGNKIKYKTTYNPLAGSFWFERMKADHMNDILALARRVARGRG